MFLALYLASLAFTEHCREAAARRTVFNLNTVEWYLNYPQHCFLTHVLLLSPKSSSILIALLDKITLISVDCTLHYGKA